MPVPKRVMPRHSNIPAVASVVVALAALLVATPVVGVAQKKPKVPPRDSVFWAQPADAVRDAILPELSESLIRQRKAWKKDELREHGPLSGNQWEDPQHQRIAMLHCDTDGKLVIGRGQDYRGEPAWASPDQPIPGQPTRTYPVPSQIRSRSAPRIAFCPNFIPPGFLGGRYKAHDVVGTAPTPAMLAPFSPSLITLLDSATQRFPTEPWFVGQLVRVLVENGDRSGVAAAIARCTALRDWCGLLAGYAAHGFGDVAKADLLFSALRPQLPAAEQLKWWTAQWLLNSDDVAHYQGLPLADRLSVDQRLWWLATPFFSDGANFRRAEQIVRQVRMTLVLGAPLDPIYDFGSEYGTDAVVGLRLRYGWADHPVWGGDDQDLGHSYVHLQLARVTSVSAPEYSRAIVALAPPLATVYEPLTFTDSLVALSGPDSAYVATQWWPTEFYRYPTGRIVPLGTQQRLWLRRDSGAVFVVGTNLDGSRFDRLPAATPVTLALALAHSTAPDSARVLERVPATPRNRAVVRGAITAPGLVSIEATVHQQGVAGARTRFGVATPPSLTALAPATCAVSELALLDPTVTTPADDPWRALLGSTRLIKPRVVRIAWESYGFPPGDSVAIAVRLARRAKLTALDRLSIKLGLTDDPNSAIGVSWSEPTPGRAAVTVPGTVPIVVRELRLDVSRLAGGDYQLEVAMERTGCTPAHGERALVIER